MQTAGHFLGAQVGGERTVRHQHHVHFPQFFLHRLFEQLTIFLDDNDLVGQREFFVDHRFPFTADAHGFEPFVLGTFENIQRRMRTQSPDGKIVQVIAFHYFGNALVVDHVNICANLPSLAACFISMATRLPGPTS